MCNILNETVISLFIEAKSSLKTPLASIITKESPTQIKVVEVTEEDDSKKNREQSWKRMKYTLMAFGFSFTCLGVYLIIELGKPRIGEDGEPLIDAFSEMPKWKQYIMRTVNELNYYRQVRFKMKTIGTFINSFFFYS